MVIRPFLIFLLPDAHQSPRSGGETYEVIFGVVGRGSFSRSVRALKANGHYQVAVQAMETVLGL